MTEYYRLSGGGNDFLALVEPIDEPQGSQISAWCRRGVSLGADGVFVLRRQGSGVRMDYYNADGRAADLCLNGTRCAAQLAISLGWIDDPAAGFPIVTGAGALTAKPASGDRIEIELPPPEEPPVRCALNALDGDHNGFEMTVGVPHFVLLVGSSLSERELDEIGPALRYHSHFAPGGANINWIERRPNGFAIRTWERGVEAETLACGTGVLAAAASAVAAGEIDLPAEVETRGGFRFTVRGSTVDGRIETWSLIGDARLLSRGEIYPGALVRPEDSTDIP